MASKRCIICGKYSGIYPLCSFHLALKRRGGLIKNSSTGFWELKEKGSENELTEEEKKQVNLYNRQVVAENHFFSSSRKDEECVICGKVCKDGNLCYSCKKSTYKFENNLNMKSDKENLINDYNNLLVSIKEASDESSFRLYCYMLIAHANFLKTLYDDSYLVDKVLDDIKEAKQYLKNNGVAFVNLDSVNKKEENKESENKIIKSLDGHIVKEKSECIIDNILYNNMIVHCYEKEVIEINDDAPIIANFFIPIAGNKGIYVMIFKSDVDKDSLEKREKLINNDVPFIEVYLKDFKDISSLTNKINKEIIKWRKILFD